MTLQSVSGRENIHTYGDDKGTANEEAEAETSAYSGTEAERRSRAQEQSALAMRCLEQEPKVEMGCITNIWTDRWMDARWIK